MVRAILHDGKIALQDALPSEWREGQLLRIEELIEADETPESIDRWYQELELLCAAADPEDDERLRVALAKADEQAKAMV
jgi:hypothetical protein